MAHACGVQNLAFDHVRSVGAGTPVDGEEFGEREPSFAEQSDMAGDWFSDVRPAAAVDHLEGAVVLGKTFVEPQRCVRKDSAQKQMGVFVEHDVERPLSRLDVERDVVDVLSRLEESSNSNNLSVAAWHERLVTSAVTKHQHDHRGSALVAKDRWIQLRDDFPELLEPESDVAELACAGIADDEEVIGP